MYVDGANRIQNLALTATLHCSNEVIWDEMGYIGSVESSGGGCWGKSHVPTCQEQRKRKRKTNTGT